MKSIITISLASFATTISALPTPSTTVQFTNDGSGRNTNVFVPLGGVQSVAVLLDNTALDVTDSFFATSLFLQSNFQGVKCDFVLPGFTVSINERQPFARFAPVSNPLNLVDAKIQCSAVV